MKGSSRMAPRFLDYATPKRWRTIDWLHVVSVAALAWGAVHLVMSPLVLAVPGEFVDAYLHVILWCSIALALSRKRVVKIISLLIILWALRLAHTDWEQGLIWNAKNLSRAVDEAVAAASSQ